MKTGIEPTETVGHIASRVPNAHRVFMRHGIDFCCGGHRPLAEASREADQEIEQLIRELDEAAQTDSQEHVNWEERSSMEIISFIVDHYHRPLKTALPRLEELGERVLRAHGERHGDQLEPLGRLVQELSGELTAHMAKEERVLFPAILADNQRVLGQPIAAMEAEHRDAGEKLEQVRRLTNDFTLPEDACNTFRAYWEELSSLDRELKQHIHLENNILFPRVLAA